MVKPENISSRNIKYLEIQDHGGHFEAYFKASNQWYNVSHDGGSILELSKLSFKQINKIISEIHNNPKQYRIFEPDKQNKFYNMSVPSYIEHVLYDTNMGRPIFSYGEDDEITVTARQIAQNYTKIKNKI